MCICVGGSSGRELNCDFNPGLRKAVLADLYFWSPSVIQCASCPERLSGFPSKHPFMNRKSALRVPKDRSKEVFADCQSKAYAAACGKRESKWGGCSRSGLRRIREKRMARGWTFVFEREDTVIFPESIREIL